MRKDFILGVTLTGVLTVAAVGGSKLYKSYKQKRSFDKLSTECELIYLRTMCENEISSYEYVVGVPGLSEKIAERKLDFVREIISSYNGKLEYYDEKYPDVTNGFKFFKEAVDEYTGSVRFEKVDALSYTKKDDN